MPTLSDHTTQLSETMSYSIPTTNTTANNKFPPTEATKTTAENNSEEERQFWQVEKEILRNGADNSSHIQHSDDDSNAPQQLSASDEPVRSLLSPTHLHMHSEPTTPLMQAKKSHHTRRYPRTKKNPPQPSVEFYQFPSEEETQLTRETQSNENAQRIKRLEELVKELQVQLTHYNHSTSVLWNKLEDLSKRTHQLSRSRLYNSHQRHFPNKDAAQGHHSGQEYNGPLWYTAPQPVQYGIQLQLQTGHNGLNYYYPQVKQ